MSGATQLREAATEIADSAPMLHTNLAAALVAAKAELLTISAAQTAQIPTKAGGSFSYSFANLADVFDVVNPVLAKHGLAVFTPVHEHGNGLGCTVQFLHCSGEERETKPLPFQFGHDAQATGSMITYHRRYALLAALGLATRSDDDDGASARPRQATVAAPPETLPTAPDVPGGMSLKDARAFVRELAGGSSQKANEAWVSLCEVPRTEVDLTAAWTEWVNQPRDEPDAGEATSE